MPIDLTYPRQVVEELILTDRATITRVNPNPHEAVFNDVTGEYENYDAATVVMVANTLCKVRWESETPYDSPSVMHEVFSKVSFPWDVNTLERGDVVTITASDDPRLVGHQCHILEIEESTLRVVRRVLCIWRQGAYDPAS